MKYEVCQDEYDLEDLFKYIEDSSYKERFNDFWTTPTCYSGTKNDSKVPVIFNTATSVVRSKYFPEQIHDYLLERNENSPHPEETWLKAINTPTSDGFTFLDYMKITLDRDYYSTPKTREAALYIIRYLCKTGGVYLKYKNVAKSP